LFSKKGDIDEDVVPEGQFGRIADTAISTAAAGDKSSKASLGFGFMRKSKKVDKAASESSGRASEAGDEEALEDI
jgi:hypothetical protein